MHNYSGCKSLQWQLYLTNSSPTPTPFVLSRGKFAPGNTTKTSDGFKVSTPTLLNLCLPTIGHR